MSTSELDADDPNEWGRYFITGKALERHFKLEDALSEFTRLFSHRDGNDRALAVVGGAFLELLLENILVTFLVDDEKEVGALLNRSLATYANRVQACYCLGLIDAMVRDDLAAVGKIRNRFAHDLYASFGDQQIRSWCSGLQWHRKAFMIPPPDASERDLFYVGVNQLVCHLNGMVSIARGEKRVARPS
jgi:hypothetical protein